MQQGATISGDNRSTRAARDLDGLGLRAESRAIGDKGGSDAGCRGARVQDGQEGGIVAAGGHIGKVEGRPGMRCTQHIAAAADPGEVA